MKKQLSALFAVLVAIFSLSAQTVENPLQLKLGTNVYTFPSDPEEWSYYRYAPAEDQELLITARYKSFIVWGYEYEDGQVGEGLRVYQHYLDDGTGYNRMLVNQGQEYLIMVETGLNPGVPGTTVSFEVQATPRSRMLGIRCGSPVQLSQDTPQMITVGYENGLWVNNYVAYTATEDCTLELVADYGPWKVAVSTSCEDEFTPIEEGPASADFFWPVQAVAGQEYIFRVNGITPTLVWVRERHYTEGSSCEAPFEAVIGANRVPAAAGTYYYRIMAPQLKPEAPDNFIHLTSDINLENGFVALSPLCGAPDDMIVVNDDILRLRARVLSRQWCIVIVNKPEDTATDETFDLRFMSEEPYDDLYTAPSLLPGFMEYSPDYAGTYYYSVTAPEEPGMLMKIESDYEVKSGVHVNVRKADYLYSVLAEGTPYIRYTGVTPNATYLITWTQTGKDYAVPFTVSFEKAPQGETIYWPFEAQIGNNEVPAGGPMHFSYVGTMSGWVNVKPQGGLGYPSVRFVRYDDFNSSLAVFPTADGGYRFYSEKGREFTITFNNVPEGASFDMSETPYGPGESFDTAIEVNGNFNIKATPGTYWYKYEPGKSQFLNISTDLTFGFGEGPVEGFMSGVYVYLNNLENYEPMPANWLTGEISAMNKTITADDVLYFEVSLKDMQNDVNFNIRARDPFPGEVYDNPIPIENKGNPTVVAFPAIELNNVGRWYSIDLVPGTLEMIAGESITIQVYPSYNTEYEIAHAGWLKYDRETNVTYYGFGHGNTTYYPALEVKDAGTYLLKVREIRNACDITLSGSALGDSNGVESVLANPGFNVTAGTGEIRVTGNADVKVFSVDGAMVASKAVSGIATIEVAPGIYLVQANGQSVKVAVK